MPAGPSARKDVGAMPFFHSLLKAVKDVWRRRRRPGPRARLRTEIALERLDHRQLLSVTFTGNAAADIPDNSGPGFAVVNNSQRIVIDPILAPLIKVSGFDISALRMFYTPQDDILSFAIQQPPNEKTSPQFPVIAGDADNNLNGGTVSPAVLALQPLYRDFPMLGGSETMYVFLSLKNNGIPDVVAGISNDPGVVKTYHVAQAVVNPDPTIAANTAPQFGATLENNTGFSFLDDTDPAHGAFEFQIQHFSQLYQQETGHALTASAVIDVGSFSGSADDFASELFIKAQPVSLGVGPISNCPPLSPPVLIAPHENRHVNIAHASYVRVNIFGTSGFNVTDIVPGSVEFGGAKPVFSFDRHINRDHFLDATYVFRSDQLNLPPGVQYAAVTGLYNDPITGTQVPFSSSNQIFVRDSSSYTSSQIAAQQARLAKTGDPIPSVPGFIQRRAHISGVTLVAEADSTPSNVVPASSPTVRLALRNQASGGAATSAVINRAPGFRRQTVPYAGHQVKGNERIALTPAASRELKAQAAATRKARALHVHDLALASVASA
jgi:hypothetical protein